MTVEQLLLLALVVLLANAVEAMAGFGATIIAVTIGSLWLPTQSLVVLLVPLNCILSAWIVLRHWRGILRQELLQNILPLTFLGVPVGLLLFTLAPEAWLKTVFGGFVLALAVFDLLSIYRRGSAQRPLTTWFARCCLFAGGIIQGLYGSGGPLVVYYAARAIPDKTQFRSTVSALWLILNVLVAGAHWFTGLATRQSYITSLQLLPAVFLGIVLGEYLHQIVPQTAFRTLVMLLLLLAGLAILITSG